LQQNSWFGSFLLFTIAHDPFEVHVSVRLLQLRNMQGEAAMETAKAGA
jgi:hypothetical protein